VARFLLPRLKEAAGVMNMAKLIDFYFEKPVKGGGVPDLTAEKGGKGLFIIEAKFKKKIAKIERDIDPRDPEVIIQAFNYAGLGGFPYYATCNSKRLILFQLRSGIKALESEIASFEYAQDSDWAEKFLKAVLGLLPVELKPLDHILVDTLLEAFADLYPEFLSALKAKLDDRKFRDSYIDWLESQGLRLNDQTNRIIAKQTTYLQLNKLLFYQVIRVIYPNKLLPLKIGEDEDVSDALCRFFTAAKKIDYTPVFQEDLISEIPFTPRAEERVRTLLDTLSEFDFSKMESDFIGRIYERLIPPLERKRLGQFYTPPEIVDLIARLAIRNPDDIVMDPGCGSGTFLVGSYHRLRKLKNIPRRIEGPIAESFHQELLKQLYGVDINQFPAHLTVINLAIQNPRARIEKVNTVVSDVFDIKPGQATLSGFDSITTEGKPILVKMPSVVDAIVANPPYIEQELLGAKEKKKIKELIEWEYPQKLFLGVPGKSTKNAIILDRQSDIYIYFYIHGIRFLKNRGRLGFISSNKWLEVNYGKPFQQFLMTYTRVLYVIEFDRAVFADAEVNTVVVILEKESDKQKRSRNVIKFIRLKKHMDIETEIKLIENLSESHEDDKIRVNLVRQGEITEGKWSINLRAPPVLQKILGNARVKPLNRVAEVFRGPTTGCDNFFVLSEEDVERFGIESRFLKPCVSSPKRIRGLLIEKNKIKEYLFLVNEPKGALEGTNALKYIEYGERLEVEPRKGSYRKKLRIPDLETMKNREPWYSLPDYEAPPILLVKMLDKRPRALWNKTRALASNLFYYVIPKAKDDQLILLGFLNSSLAAFLTELFGRSYGGGVLELAAYELKQLPAIDPSVLSSREKIEISDAFLALAQIEEEESKVEKALERVRSKSKKDRGLFETDVQEKLVELARAQEKAIQALDRAICEALGLSADDLKHIKEGLKSAQELRRLRSQG
jgi:type I restriction-modification system DNA methylase subunit